MKDCDNDIWRYKGKFMEKLHRTLQDVINYADIKTKMRSASK